MNFIKKYGFEKIFFSLMFFTGVIYIANSWSPSSYGIMLKQIQPDDTGIIYGKPRPIRSDEWAVVTPLTQATINNNFQRYNKTSPYNEDLRINYGLPIFDWGLIFKPTMWGYLFLQPSTAYSVHWFLIFALFIIGYYKLFIRIGFNPLLSVGVSFSLYFTGFAQFWWDEKGPVIAFFPWVIYSLICAQKNSFVKSLFFYWLGTSWLLTNFYPPVFISLAFVGALLFLCYGESWFSIKKIILLILSSIAIVATTLLYLKDYLTNTQNTLYPGHRSLSGGAVNWHDWFAQYFPFSTFDRHFDIFNKNLNICEIGAVGLPFVLMLLCHIDFKKPFSVSPSYSEKKKFLILTCGLILMNIWMIIPIPSWMGAVFLWNNVHPQRMLWAEGTLLAITTVLISKSLNFVFNYKRGLIFSCLIIIFWIITKVLPQDIILGRNLNDLSPILALFIGYILFYKYKLDAVTALVIPSAFISAVILFPFNPIQSSIQIFGPHKNIKNSLDPEVDKKTGIIAVTGYPGATLNGLGYKSISHVTAVPDLDFWRKQFPDLSQAELNNIFNRYSHIILADVAEPISPAPDQVLVPISHFTKHQYIPKVDLNSALEPLQLGNNGVLSGEIAALPSGRLSEFSPFIGNYMNTSTGTLKLKICNSNQCRTANASLIHSQDNQYLSIYLESPLVIESSGVTTYSFTLENASEIPVAFWITDSTNDKTYIFDTMNRKMDKTLKLEISYDN